MSGCWAKYAFKDVLPAFPAPAMKKLGFVADTFVSLTIDERPFTDRFVGPEVTKCATGVKSEYTVSEFIRSRIFGG